MRKLIKECRKQGVFEKNRDLIRAWLTYLDQKRFSKKVEKQILAEIKRYLRTRDKVILDYIVEVIWNETDTEAWIIVIPK
ncbi:hypothetical protein ES708_14155 [subsurface metagenome]